MKERLFLSDTHSHFVLLWWHIMTYKILIFNLISPHLNPHENVSMPCREGGGGYDSGDDHYKSNGMSYGGYNNSRPTTASSTRGYKPKTTMTGLYKRSTPKRSNGEASGSMRPSSAGGGANLRPSQRYNFYRYYGNKKFKDSIK